MGKIVISQNELKSLIENVLNESFNNDQVLEGKNPYYILGMVKNANRHTLKDLKTLQNLIDSGEARYDRFFISGYLKGIITSLEQMNEVISNEETDDANDQDMIGEAKKTKGKKKIKKVMGEFQKGELKTSYGTKVTDPKQAVAIAYSEAGLSKNKKNESLEEEIKEAIKKSITEVYNKSSLPNKVGFKFVAIYDNGDENIQEVKKDENGQHYIDNWNSIIGWKLIK